MDLPPPPREPEDAECCGRGCDPCIFDYYERALTRWRDRVVAAGGDPDEMLQARNRGGPTP